MRVILVRDYEEMTERAAALVEATIRQKPNAVLGAASGSTPEGLYGHLGRISDEGLDCSRISAFTVDEYVGLSPDHPQSLRHFMDERLFNPLGLIPNKVHSPNTLGDSLNYACQAYDAEVADAGGVDLFILGIGRDGHIGFNEPGTSLGSRTHVVGLAPETVEDNARFFENVIDVPRFAVTMGIQTILEGRQLLLLANGENKARALAAALEGPLTSSVTASAIQMHPDVVVIADTDAAANLRRRDYYRWQEDNLPMIEHKL